MINLLEYGQEQALEECGPEAYRGRQKKMMANLWKTGDDAAAEVVAKELQLGDTFLRGCQLLHAAFREPTTETVEKYAQWLEECGYEEEAEFARANGESLWRLFFVEGKKLPPIHADYCDQLRWAIADVLDEHPDMEKAFYSGLALDESRRRAVMTKKNFKVSFIGFGILAAMNAVLALHFGTEGQNHRLILCASTAVVTGCISSVAAAIMGLFHLRAQSLTSKQQQCWNECPVRCIDPNR